MQKIKHSKFRNTGILFELLVRQVTSDILEGKEVSKANHLLQKYFKENHELGKENSLYQLILKENTKSENSAQLFLEMVIKARTKLNTPKLSEQKYNLIKEIKEMYPIEDFLNGKISNYKLLASVYKLFEEVSSIKDFDPKDLYESKTYIIESLYRKPSKKIALDEFKENSELMEIYKNEDDDSKFLIYKLVVDNFNQKYKTVFDDKQTLLLKEYLYNISNTNSLRDYVDKEVLHIQNILKTKISECSDDTRKIKLLEVSKNITKFTEGSTVRDNQILGLLNCYELIKELNANN